MPKEKSTDLIWSQALQSRFFQSLIIRDRTDSSGCEKNTHNSILTQIIINISQVSKGSVLQIMKTGQTPERLYNLKLCQLLILVESQVWAEWVYTRLSFLNVIRTINNLRPMFQRLLYKAVYQHGAYLRESFFADCRSYWLLDALSESLVEKIVACLSFN